MRYVAYLIEGHEYDEALRFLARHVVWQRRLPSLQRALVLARAGPPVTGAMPRWLETESIADVIALPWRWVTSADPRWSDDDDQLYRCAWAETIVVGRATQLAPPERRLVEQIAIHDGTATREMNPALAPLLRIEFFDEVRAQLALRDRCDARLPAAG